MTSLSSTVPVCVDLDGTLIRTDMLYESLLAALRRRPWLMVPMPFWLLAGKSGFKRRVAAYAEVNPATLPYHQDLLAWLREQRRHGRRLVLATASDRQLAVPIAEHLGIFDEVLGSDGHANLAGARKRHALVERFGDRGFDYVGNSHTDLEVWAASRTALPVNAPPKVVRALEGRTMVEKLFPREERSLRTMWRAVRPHQWAKNLLVFVPLITSHRIVEISLLWQAVEAFAAFCLCSSAVYVVNDLLDLEADRGHPEKKSRPFASGALSIRAGLLLAPALAAAGMAVAALLPAAFAVVMASYILLTSVYSLWIKRMVLLDVFTLSFLYALRIAAGHETTAIAYSPWLLSFAMFLFLSLALGKRVSELGNLRRRGEQNAAGRGYSADDLEILKMSGVASGFVASLVLALYINSPAVALLYSRPLLLWMLCPLTLYWIARIWILASQGKMDEDPIAFAVRDAQTYIIGGAALLVLTLAARMPALAP